MTPLFAAVSLFFSFLPFLQGPPYRNSTRLANLSGDNSAKQNIVAAIGRIAASGQTAMAARLENLANSTQRVGLWVTKKLVRQEAGQPPATTVRTDGNVCVDEGVAAGSDTEQEQDVLAGILDHEGTHNEQITDPPDPPPTELEMEIEAHNAEYNKLCILATMRQQAGQPNGDLCARMQKLNLDFYCAWCLPQHEHCNACPASGEDSDQASAQDCQEQAATWDKTKLGPLGPCDAYAPPGAGVGSYQATALDANGFTSFQTSYGAGSISVSYLVGEVRQPPAVFPVPYHPLAIDAHDPRSVYVGGTQGSSTVLYRHDFVLTNTEQSMTDTLVWSGTEIGCITGIRDTLQETGRLRLFDAYNSAIWIWRQTTGDIVKVVDAQEVPELASRKSMGGLVEFETVLQPPMGVLIVPVVYYMMYEGLPRDLHGPGETLLILKDTFDNLTIDSIEERDL